MPCKLEKKAYSIAEAARLLSLKRDEVEWLIDTGQLRTILIAGRRLVIDKDIDDLLHVYREVQSRAATGLDKGDSSGGGLGAQKAGATTRKSKRDIRNPLPES